MQNHGILYLIIGVKTQALINDCRCEKELLKIIINTVVIEPTMTDNFLSKSTMSRTLYTTRTQKVISKESHEFSLVSSCMFSNFLKLTQRKFKGTCEECADLSRLFFWGGLEIGWAPPS